MALRSLIVSALLTRTTPVVVSVALHAGVAVGLVASVGGHARAGVASEVASAELDVAVDVVTETPEPPPSVTASNDIGAPAQAHTHAYPVAPSHDARPHDPSLHHEEAPSAPPSPSHDHAPSESAAPALTAEGSGVLPRFTIPSGAGATASGPASASATPSSPTSTSSDAEDVTVAASAVQVPARLVHSVAAAYPVDARADEIEGDVGLEVVVDREGRVVESRVARSAGHGFDEAAAAAVRRYRFSPAQREGRAVRVRMPWSVQFRLR